VGGYTNSVAGGFAGAVAGGAAAGATAGATATTLTPGSNSGDIWKATYRGAALGGATKATLYGAKLLGQSIHNWSDGYGFHTNNTILNGMASRGAGQDMVDFSADRYGTAPGKYDPTNPSLGPNDFAFTNMQNSEVTYGKLILDYPSAMQATGWHEGVHVGQSQGNWQTAGRYPLEMDAGRSTIWRAQRLDLTSQALKDEIGYYNDNAAHQNSPAWSFR
jgi:hypothetical protein